MILVTNGVWFQSVTILLVKETGADSTAVC